MTQWLPYALIKSGEIVEERNYKAPPISRTEESNPVLRPIVTVEKPFNPFTQNRTIQRRIEASRVVDEWMISSKTVAEMKSQNTAILKAYRWEKQTGGVPSTSIPSDELTANILEGADLRAKADADFVIHDWTVGDSDPVDLDSATIQQLYAAVSTWWQRCYSAQSVVLANIAGYTSAAAIKAAFDEAMEA